MTDAVETGIRQLESLVGEAARAASEYHTHIVGPEHLLYVIAGCEEGRRAIETMNGRPRRIREFLEGCFGSSAQHAGGGAVESDLVLNAPLQRVIRNCIDRSRETQKPFGMRAAIMEMMHLGRECMTTREAVRAGGLLETAPLQDNSDYRLEEEVEDEGAAYGPEAEGPAASGEADAAVEARAGDGDRGGGQHAGTEPAPAEEKRKPGEGDEHRGAVLEAIRDVTEEARRGVLDDVVGREKVIAHVAQSLSRRRKPNVVLSGEPGVGKTAVAEGLAAELAGGRAPEALATRPLLEVSINQMVAGARFRGDFEARMRELVRIATERKAILFIDEIHTIMGAGTGSARGGLDGANILKPALARGDISLLGATTPEEMRELRKDGALMRRFEVVNIAEPTAAETRRIVDQAVGAYVLHHEVEIDDTMLDSIVDLADRHITARRFPDKAFDVIDTAATIAAGRGAAAVEPVDIRSAVTRIGGVGIGGPESEKAGRLDGVGAALRAHVFGQDAAAAELSRAVRSSALGLESSGVAGTYLFNGPTGVGKTAMAEALAEALEIPLVRVDLSEFTEKHSIARLIGAPPGYVGYDEEGILVAAADAHPEMVLLLDELGKAHPAVFDMLLPLLDKGVLRAADGRQVSFRGTHVVATANIGADEAERPALGFGRATDRGQAFNDALEATFRKEFLGRLRHRILFEPLGAEALEQVATAELDRAARRLGDSGYEVVFEPSIARHLAADTAGNQYAVRALQNAIRERVHDPLSAILLDASSGAQSGAQSARRLQVAVEDGEMVFRDA